MILLPIYTVAADKIIDEYGLAMKLQNPVANLISVPIQNNWDFGSGSTNAMNYRLNVQPIIPISISNDWSLITRTIIPINHVESQVEGGENISGLGDIVQSFFFSPKKSFGGLSMGGGPVFLYPIATENKLGGGKWGAGPTIVLLHQKNGWTYGVLANHIKSFAGTSNTENVSATLVQPRLSYTTETYTTFGISPVLNYNWQQNQWNVPVNLTVSQLVKFGNQPIQFQFGGRYFPVKPNNAPEWGLRFGVTFMFPK